MQFSMNHVCSNKYVCCQQGKFGLMKKQNV